MKKKNYIDYEDGTRVFLDEDDVPEWTAEDFKRAVSFSELPKSLQKKLKTIQKNAAERRGRPKSPAPKQMIAFRFSADVVAAIKTLGKGYNVQVERLLREALKEGRM